MQQHQDVDVFRDVLGIGLELLQIELPTQLLDQHPRLGLALRADIEATVGRQAAQQAQGRALGVGQGLQQAADVVLEELFLVRREKLDRLGVVLLIGTGQAEVHGRPALPQRHGLQAELGGLVLFRGKRQRVDDVQADLAVGLALVDFEQFLDPLGIAAHWHQFLRAAVGKVEIQVERLFQLRENLPGASADGIELVLGQVEPDTGEQQPCHQVEGQEQQGNQQQAGSGIQHAFHRIVLTRLSSG